MAATLSFRPPQFSEDVAWLPIWLQHCQGESVKEFEESSNPHIQLVQEVAICENSIERKDASLLSADERRINNFYLFLSGEDDASASFSSPFGQSREFQLHLSSSGTIPSPENIHRDISRGQILQTNEFLSTKHVKESAFPGPSVKQFEVDINVTPGKLPRISSNADTPDLSNPLQVTPKADLPELNNNILIRKTENASVAKMDHHTVGVNQLPPISRRDDYRNDNMESDSKRMHSETDYKLEDAAIDLAVELSIAASEALVIHEFTCDTGSETLSAAALLEVSLRMKQARSKEVSLFSGEDNDDIDSLTDLDESTMADAFADVGLLLRDPDDELVCDSPVAGHFEEFDDGFSYMEHRASIKCAIVNPAVNAVVSSESNLPSETLQDEVQKKLCDESSSDWKVSDTPDNPDLENLDCAVSPQEAAHNNTDVRLTNEKTIPTVFAWETSFLSESSIIPSDQNSFAPIKGSRSRIASESSTPFEGPYDQAIDGLFSQEINNPTISPVDPLCSIVPCSISSDKDTYVQQQPFHENATEHGNENWFFPKPDVSLEKTVRMSDVKSASEKLCHLPNINSKASVLTARRLSTSLKTYSVLSPNCNAFCEMGIVCNNGPCPTNGNLKKSPSGKIINSFESSDDRDETVILPSSFLSKLNHHKTWVSEDLVTETATEKTKGVETQVLPEDSRSPLNMSGRILHPLQISTEVDTNFTEKGGPKYPSALIECQHRKQIPDPELYSNSADSCSAQVPIRKRVRFSEATVQLQEIKKLQKQHPENKNRSILKTFKRLKPSNLLPDSITLEVKRRLTHHYSKYDHNRLVFQGMEFLLTGLSSQKEKDCEGLVRKYGGTILLHIPSLPPSSMGKRSKKPNDHQIPVILCSKKLQTTKFLYGCAVNAYILKTNWLVDSIAAGSVLPPEKYMILSNPNDGKCTEIQTQFSRTSHDHIFERVGIMLLGKHSFCTKLAEIFKHGGGYVFKTLHHLIHRLDTGKIRIAAVIVEDKVRASRHLKHCASEMKIPIMSASWMINSLHLGRLLPVTDSVSPTLSPIKVPEIRISIGFSEEI